ncbi:MAG TPA: hypothetical protein VFV78_07740 [Vicinamibacterales bacterium]|nr:hypothetical protein [Vicinamibacterales bacterium]
MDLICELLDIQVRDRHFRKVGRVDGIVLEWRQGEPARVVAIEMGGAVLAKRLHPRLRRWYETLGRWWHFRTGAIRIAARHISSLDLSATLDIDAKTDPALLATERYLAGRFRGGVPR